MSAARFEYVALFLGAAAYFHGRLNFAELLLFIGAAVAICEIAMYRLSRKIAAWPSDVENGQRVIDLMASNETIDEIMALEFGSARNELIDRLQWVKRPGIQQARFHDEALGASFRYLQEKVTSLLGVIGSEMFSADGRFDGQMLPLEWKATRHDSEMHARYRQAQRDLLMHSRKVVEAIEAFANCFQGASRRL